MAERNAWENTWTLSGEEYLSLTGKASKYDSIVWFPIEAIRKIWEFCLQVPITLSIGLIIGLLLAK